MFHAPRTPSTTRGRETPLGGFSLREQLGLLKDQLDRPLLFVRRVVVAGEEALDLGAEPGLDRLLEVPVDGRRLPHRVDERVGNGLERFVTKLKDRGVVLADCV